MSSTNTNLCIQTEDTWVRTGQYLANLTSIPLLKDIVPRLILNKSPQCIPQTAEIIQSVISSLIAVLSIFVVFKVVSPSFFSTYTTLFLVIAFFLLPIITVIVVKLYRSFVQDGKEEIGLSIVYLVSMAPILGFIILLSWYMVDFEQMYIKLFVTIFIAIPIIFAIVSIAYIVAPTMILLLGPGVIPFLQNQSFFQYCS